MQTTILLLSDTHGALHPEILGLASDADGVIHAGDLGSEAVLASLREVSDNVHCVIGNNDTRSKWSETEHRTLNGLPETLSVPLHGDVLAVEHGHRANPAKRRHEILRRRHAGARLIVYGHSHRFVIDRANSPWVVNPGAAGRSRTFGGPSCILLTITGETWKLTTHRFTW